MSVEENKEVILRYWDELNKGKTDYMDECLTDDFINYRIDGTALDKKGYIEFNKVQLDTFPDAHITIHDIIGEGDKVAFHFTLTGTQKKEFGGNPPPGKPVSVSEAFFARLKGGKITEFRNFQAQIKLID